MTELHFILIQLLFFSFTNETQGEGIDKTPPSAYKHRDTVCLSFIACFLRILCSRKEFLEFWKTWKVKVNVLRSFYREKKPHKGFIHTCSGGEFTPYLSAFCVFMNVLKIRLFCSDCSLDTHGFVK